MFRGVHTALCGTVLTRPHEIRDNKPTGPSAVSGTRKLGQENNLRAAAGHREKASRGNETGGLGAALFIGGSSVWLYYG